LQIQKSRDTLLGRANVNNHFVVKNFNTKDFEKKLCVYEDNIFLLISEYDDTNIVNFLLKHYGFKYLLRSFQYNINGIDNFGRSPIHYLYKSTKLISMFIYKFGADINNKSKDGSDIGFFVSEAGYTKVLKYIIKHGYNIYSKNRLGQNILRRIVEFHYPEYGNNVTEIALILLKNGLNPREKDFFGKSAMDVAIENNMTDLLHVFLKEEKRPNTKMVTSINKLAKKSLQATA
jgi:ankyrin repeat protein